MRRVTVYDSMSREVRGFAPMVPPRVGLFVCGLTPYAEAHVGHGRLFVVFDVVARALRRWGYRVLLRAERDEPRRQGHRPGRRGRGRPARARPTGTSASSSDRWTGWGSAR